MQKKISTNQKRQQIVKYCKNKLVTDEFIEKYQDATKGAIEQIVNMGLAVKEVKEKEQAGILNNYDIKYFCQSVGLSEKSSTFRKYKCIGEKADLFKEYMNKMPSAFSTLYEIATLDGDVFEKLIKSGLLTNDLTLKQVKILTNKNTPLPNLNKKLTTQSYVSSSSITKVVKKINRITINVSRTLNKTQFDEVIRLLSELQNRQLIRFDLPELIETQTDIDDVNLKLAA
jgi:hypothetical protein